MPYQNKEIIKNIITKNHKIMKKSMILMLVFVLTMSVSAWADNDRVITFNQLPPTAQALLNEHFGDKTPLIVTTDSDDYTVRYKTGEKVEFDKKGNWREIDCGMTQVPDVLIPQAIMANISATFPETGIVKIDRDRQGYDVKLSTGFELEFNRNFQLVDMDD